MPTAVRRFAEYLGLVDTDEYQDYEPVATDYSRVDYPSIEQIVSPSTYAPRASAPVASPTPSPTASRFAAPDAHQRITTSQPHHYNDARGIGEDFRNGVPVIINLNDLDDIDARRIVDFAAGLTFGLRGSIERIAPKVFLLSPESYDVSAAARAQLDLDQFYNQS